jgi:hypothetical protein
MNSYHSQVNGWYWRTSFYVKLARLRSPKIICSPSYVDFTPKTKAVILLDMGHTLRTNIYMRNRERQETQCLQVFDMSTVD